VTRRSVTMGVLAPVLLAVGVLSVTFIDQVAGQTAPAEATATVSATATAAASSTCAGESAPALDQRLPFGTCMPAEDVESAVETAGTAIGSINCEKYAGNPRIASSYFPDAAKTVGGVIRCRTKKGALHAQARLWKKLATGLCSRTRARATATTVIER
jgi:hypothetical protein